MWLLKHLSQGTVYYLVVGKEHVIGRKDGDLILADDQSISRKHAIIKVAHEIKNLGDINKFPVVTITDANSKYGTYINSKGDNSNRMENKSTQILKDGDTIQFGVQWNQWRLEYVPLIVTTSTLTPDEKKNLKQHIVTLGGHIVSSWQNVVTHVTMCNLTLTVKVVCALACAKPIILPKYWEDFITALSTKGSIPNCKDYIPPLAESTLNINEVSFDINENRKTLFSGKHFLFSTILQFNSYSCMVTSAGGKADILDQNNINKTDLIKSDVIVMQYMIDRLSQNSEASQSFQEITKYLRNNGRRVIPESEIGLAILHCSIEKNCNPEFNVASALLSKQNRENEGQVVLALDTQYSETDAQKRRKVMTDEVIIPESGTVAKPSSSSGSTKSSSSSNSIKTISQKENNDGKENSTAGIKRERISIADEEVDAVAMPRKRMKNLEDDGFLKKKSISKTGISCQILPEHNNTMQKEMEIKTENDEEDMFDFPSDKKIKAVSRKPSLSDDEKNEEDMFAFSDENQQSNISNQKEQPAKEPLEMSRKRKKISSEDINQSNCVNKRRAIKEDEQKHETDIKSTKLVEKTVSLQGFITVKHEKQNPDDEESMMGLNKTLKQVSLVEIKPLLLPSFSKQKSCLVKTTCQSGNNFKKFKKVQGVNYVNTIQRRKMILYNANSGNLNVWLNDTCNDIGKEEENDKDDWAFFENAKENSKLKRR